MGNIYRLSELYAVHLINKEKPLILNQLCDILAELQAQDKKITLCKGNKKKQRSR